MSEPDSQALPEVGLNIPVICEMKVVFPAPFGPSSPKSSPGFTLRHMLLFATLGFLPFTPGYTFLMSFATNGYYQ